MDTSLAGAPGQSISTVRPEWSYAVASTLQRAVGAMLDADVDRFAEALRSVASQTLAPATIVEQRWLHQRFMEFTWRVGRDFHTLAHPSAASSCAFLPLESTAHVWDDIGTDPRRLLRLWTTIYAEGFAQHHAASLARQAVRLVAGRFADDVTTADVAPELGVSTSTLMRRFRGALGLTVVEYRTRLRLVHAFAALRTTAAKVDDVARTVGFASVKNFNLAAKKYVELTPSDVRRLAAMQFQRLLANELEVDATLLERRRLG